MTKQELYTVDGAPVSRVQIKEAVKERRAVIHYSHGNWVNISSLGIYDDSVQAEMDATRDTRGKCTSVWDETWAELVTDPNRAIRAAAGLLKQS